MDDRLKVLEKIHSNTIIFKIIRYWCLNFFKFEFCIYKIILLFLVPRLEWRDKERGHRIQR